MSHFEVEGKVFCDWRLTIEGGCEGERLFWVSFLYSAITSGIGFLVLLSCLIFRKIFLEETLRGFFRGEALFHVTTLFIYLSHFAFVVSLLVKAPLLISGIFWSFLEVSKLLTQSTFVAITTQVIPEGLPQERSRWMPNPATSTRLLYSFCIFASITHAAILSSAFSLFDSNLSLGRKLERAGLTITAINAVFLTFGQLLGPYMLRRDINANLKGTVEFEKGQFDTTLMVLTKKKAGPSHRDYLLQQHADHLKHVAARLLPRLLFKPPIVKSNCHCPFPSQLYNRLFLQLCLCLL